MGKFGTMLIAGASTVLVLLIVWYVLQVIAYWKMFEKMGEPGWKAIIPFYNDYISFKKTWETKWFWITLVLNIATFFLANQSEPQTNTTTAMGAVSLVLAIVLLVLYIMSLHKVSLAFGKGTGFTVGLIFFNPIFKLILGFGSSQYIGNQSNRVA